MIQLVFITHLMIDFKRNVLGLLVLLLRHGQSLGIRTSFKPFSRQALSFQRLTTTTLAATPAEEWKDRAAKLRQEIQDYETLKRMEDQNRREPTVIKAPQKIEDCIWGIKYRFTLGEQDEDNGTRESYGGIVNVKFRSDGYTDLVSQTSTGQQSATVFKAWGWDIETSPDDKEYLLFSMDFQFLNRDSQRLYFQACHSRAAAVELSDGTITIKEDVVQKVSRWALFSPAGILAQFRFSGNFVAKPIG